MRNWFARTHDRWVPKVLGVCILAVFLASVADARGKKEEEVPYVPEIIEVEKPHAWCYVLKNVQNKLVGNINILACVPKGPPERNPEPIISRGSDSD